VFNPSLADVVESHTNNTKILRLVGAIFVILFHSFALTGNLVSEPLYKLLPSTNFGLLGVQIFFVLSGFLVTQSWVRKPVVRRFVAARLLRIYPALVMATIFSVFVASIASSLPLHEFLFHQDTLHYLWKTSLGYDVTGTLPQAFQKNVFPNAVNGSLWTLPWELKLYGFIAIGGALGGLRKGWVWLGLVAFMATAISLVLGPAAAISAQITVVRNLLLLFGIGSAAFVLRQRIQLSVLCTVALVVAYVIFPEADYKNTLFLPAFAYGVLVLAYHPALLFFPSAVSRMGDYSYGLYVYSFPIQQLIAYNAPGTSTFAMFAESVVIATVVSAFSWHLVERPILNLRDRSPHVW
jgi:peptidoglycan/LPS O-acetylase OafA/YrhL